MSAAKHTPGPWAWDESGYALRAVDPDPATSSVHTIMDAYGGSGFLCSDRAATLAELDADYLLIATAPELLEALQDLTLNVTEAMKTGGWIPTPLQSSFWASVSDSVAVIAKATGSAS